MSRGKRPINVQTPVRKGESIDRAIKRFSRKVKKEGIIDAYREKMYYEKPSDKKKRVAKQRAKILQKLKRKEETI
jgi:small subunit ribosomal protein S21